MTDVLVPIMICVGLPVSIVAIVYGTAINRDNKRSQVLIKAIEAGNGADVARLAEAMERKHTPSARDVFFRRVLRGSIFALIGLVFLVAGIVSWGEGGAIADDGVSGPLILGGVLMAVGLSYLLVCLLTRSEIRKN